MSKRTNKTTANKMTDLREQVLTSLSTLRLPISSQSLDASLGEAEQSGRSHLEFLQSLLAPAAAGRRERSIERRIREAQFHEVKTLEDFDWEFNAAAIDRSRIDSLATGEFVRRGDNLIFVGQSGLGKSHLLQGLGRRLCALGYRVRYATSGELLLDLTASLADQTLPLRLKYWTRQDLLIVDEFGFDRIEREACVQASSLLYKVIDGRRERSTALATNIDFEAWADYLGDPPLAMAMLDRLTASPIVFKLCGKSYRAERLDSAES
jgi:DNA replication protein DnaC